MSIFDELNQLSRFEEIGKQTVTPPLKPPKKKPKPTKKDKDAKPLPTKPLPSMLDRDYASPQLREMVGRFRREHPEASEEQINRFKYNVAQKLVGKYDLTNSVQQTAQPLSSLDIRDVSGAVTKAIGRPVGWTIEGAGQLTGDVAGVLGNKTLAHDLKPGWYLDNQKWQGYQQGVDVAASTALGMATAGASVPTVPGLVNAAMIGNDVTQGAMAVDEMAKAGASLGKQGLKLINPLAKDATFGERAGAILLDAGILATGGKLVTKGLLKVRVPVINRLIKSGATKAEARAIYKATLKGDAEEVASIAEGVAARKTNVEPEPKPASVAHKPVEQPTAKEATNGKVQAKAQEVAPVSKTTEPLIQKEPEIKIAGDAPKPKPKRKSTAQQHKPEPTKTAEEARTEAPPVENKLPPTSATNRVVEEIVEKVYDKDFILPEVERKDGKIAMRQASEDMQSQFGSGSDYNVERAHDYIVNLNNSMPVPTDDIVRRNIVHIQSILNKRNALAETLGKNHPDVLKLDSYLADSALVNQQAGTPAARALQARQQAIRNDMTPAGIQYRLDRSVERRAATGEVVDAEEYAKFKKEFEVMAKEHEISLTKINELEQRLSNAPNRPKGTMEGAQRAVEGARKRSVGGDLRSRGRKLRTDAVARLRQLPGPTSMGAAGAFSRYDAERLKLIAQYAEGWILEGAGYAGEAMEAIVKKIGKSLKDDTGLDIDEQEIIDALAGTPKEKKEIPFAQKRLNELKSFAKKNGTEQLETERLKKEQAALDYKKNTDEYKSAIKEKREVNVENLTEAERKIYERGKKLSKSKIDAQQQLLNDLRRDAQKFDVERNRILKARAETLKRTRAKRTGKMAEKGKRLEADIRKDIEEYESALLEKRKVDLSRLSERERRIQEKAQSNTASKASEIEKRLSALRSQYTKTQRMASPEYKAKAEARLNRIAEANQRRRNNAETRQQQRVIDNAKRRKERQQKVAEERAKRQNARQNKATQDYAKDTAEYEASIREERPVNPANLSERERKLYERHEQGIKNEISKERAKMAELRNLSRMMEKRIAMTRGERARNVFATIYDMIRSALFGPDNSPLAVQNFDGLLSIALSKNWKNAFGAVSEATQAAFSKEKSRIFFGRLEDADWQARIKAGLDAVVPGHRGLLADDLYAFESADVLAKMESSNIPIVKQIGQLYAASERYSAALGNAVRKLLYDEDIARMVGLTDKQATEIAQTVNHITGRGSIGNKDTMQAYMKVSSRVFAGPRLFLARFNNIGDLMKLRSAGSKGAWIRMAKVLGFHAAFASVINMTSQQTGWRVGVNPWTDPDNFLTLYNEKTGRRWGPPGFNSSLWAFMVRLACQSVHSYEKDYDPGYRKEPYTKSLQKVGYYIHPAVSVGYETAFGLDTFTGKKLYPKTENEALRRLQIFAGDLPPVFIQQAAEFGTEAQNKKDWQDFSTDLLGANIGLQTYVREPKQEKTTKKSKSGGLDSIMNKPRGSRAKGLDSIMNAPRL